MNAKATVVLFFNDWKVYPTGVNAGGGESATMALARAISQQGYRVIACANLPQGECAHNGIEFWDFGPTYALHEIEKRLRHIGPYHALCATLVHPLLVLRDHAHCLSRIVINHAPSSHASGLEPTTAMELVDYMLCVSDAQRSIIINSEIDPAKLAVVRNGFDPEVFPYAGPAGRDWNQLVFIGRIEPPKGVHVLVQAFSELKREFPDLKLSIFGDESYWPQFSSQKHELMRSMPGLVFRGKVPQRELSEQLRKAGLLVFPSISFETAGLAVVEAQASGCPAVAFGVGGVPEYLVDGVLGSVVFEKTPEALRDGIAKLLRDRQRLAEMSRAAETAGRMRPWSVVAKEVMSYAERVVQSVKDQAMHALPMSVRRIKDFKDASMQDVLSAHEHATRTEVFSECDLEKAMSDLKSGAWPYLVRGMRFENQGAIEQAIASYQEAAHRSTNDDWQAFFRLTLLYAERSEIPQASRYAKEVLSRAPEFPLRKDLERLVALSEGV
jgi:glycosyltransferase involved in cell wall biosynthesis